VIYLAFGAAESYRRGSQTGIKTELVLEKVEYHLVRSESVSEGYR
jgi:hypothetical protein